MDSSYVCDAIVVSICYRINKISDAPGVPAPSLTCTLVPTKLPRRAPRRVIASMPCCPIVPHKVYFLYPIHDEREQPRPDELARDLDVGCLSRVDA